LSGRTLDDVNGVGEPIRDESYLIMFNPHHEPIQFYMPRVAGIGWQVLFYTDRESAQRPVVGPGEYFELGPHTSAILQERAD
jgi:isoamylase